MFFFALVGVPPVQPILSPQIPSQPTDSRQYQKQPYTTNQMQPTMQAQSHRLPDASYNMENTPSDLTSTVEKQSTPDRIASDPATKRPTRYSAQAIQSTLKSPGKSPGKSPRQMEIVRQKSEAGRGRSRGARNTSGSGRGTANRAAASSRGRGRGRAPHAVPIGKFDFLFYYASNDLTDRIEHRMKLMLLFPFFVVNFWVFL